MNERNMNFRVGVMVVATFVLGAILITAFSDFGTIGRSTYTLYIKFDEAPGVAEGTPVRKSGILIGRVSDTEFNEAGDGVIVAANIQSGIKLRGNEQARIREGLLGDAVIEFVSTGEPARAAQPLTSGDFIEGEVSPDPMEAVTGMMTKFNTTASSVSNAGDEIAKLARSLDEKLQTDDGQLQRILNKLETSLDGFSRTMGNLDGVLGDADVQSELRRAITETPKLLDQSRETLDRVQLAIDSVRKNSENLEKLTEPLGRSGPELADNVQRMVSQLNQLLEQFTEFGTQLNRDDGSLGKLVRDPELYQNLNQAARNIERMTTELRPIIRDARVFSDKISRHPEMLGVRGALQRSSGIK